jgi:hypothetical protein
VKRFSVFLLTVLFASCSDDEGELPESAVALCKTAVEMTTTSRETLKWLSTFDASHLKEIEVREARIRIPASVEHVVGITYSEQREGGHYEGRAYCGFKDPKENMEIEHIVVGERELDTFSVGEVARRYKDGDATKGERL